MESIERQRRMVATMIVATDVHILVLASLRTDEPTPRLGRSVLVRGSGKA